MTKFLNNADIKGYIAQTAVTSYLLKADSTGRLVAAIAGTDYQAPTTALLPSGGTAGQILAKIDGTNYNTQWIDNYTPQVKHDVKLGAALSKGTPVYVSSANGTNMIVSAASNASEATSSKTLGLLETGGDLNDTVKVITEGLLAGLNTSTATAGDPVWLGPNGTLLFGLANKPSAPVHMVSIGIVTRVQSVNGEIFVKVQNGFELDELHNVALASSANNEGLFYDSATSLWKNKTIAAVLGYTPANDSAVVHLAGTETITGVKTFSSVINASTLSLNGGTLAGNNIVSMRSNPTGGQFRIEKSDGSLSAYPFYIGVDGTALAYYYNASGALKVLLHTDGTSYFGNSLSVGYSTYAATSYSLDVNGSAQITSTLQVGGNLYGTGATFSGTVVVASPFTIKDTNPYIQWKNASDTRLGYIQHATNLVMAADSGNIVFNTTLASATVSAAGLTTLQFNDTSGNRTSGINVLAIQAENSNAPYNGFGGAIVFNNRAYTSGIVASTRIRSQINNNSVDNSGGSLIFEVTPTVGGTLTSALSINYNSQLRLNAYTTSTSFSGTAAGYLAFDSSGNVITVAGVAATDNTKLPLAGGTTTGIVTFGGSNNSTDNVRFQNTDGNYAYIRQTAASNSNNVWYDGTLGATMWYAWDNPGSARTAGVYTQHIFGTGRGTSNEAVTINRGGISGTNSSGTQTYSITRDGSASLAGILSFSNTTGNKIDFYYSISAGVGDRYGIQVQNSELRIHSGAQGVGSGGITFGKSDSNTFTETMRVRNDGNVLLANTGTLILGIDDTMDRTVVGGASRTRLQLAPPSHTGAEWTFVTYDDSTNAYIRIGYGNGSASLQMRHDGYTTIAGNVLLHAGNYNSYSPTLTGGNASGTWGINVTGSSRSLLFSGDSAKAFLDGLWAGGGSYPGYQFTGGNSRFGFSSTSGVVDVYADGNFYATDSSYLVLHTGNIGSYTSGNSNQLQGSTAPYLFNNMNNAHGTYTDFNSPGDFGVRYMQGSTNGPGTGATQYYGFTLGLGSQYAFGTYGSQLYWNRVATGGNPYISVRFQEGGAWSSWSKIYAGYADSAGQVTINYNNDSNSTYQLLWGSGNSVYGTSQVYVNPSSDVIYARGGYISPSNPWGTSDSAYFPNGITTAGGQNWIYGATFIGNAPSNGSGVLINSNGSSYFRSNVGTNSHGSSARFHEIQSAAGNFIPYSFESEYGNHSWGTVLRIRINQVGADRPSMQFSYAGTDNRWNVGYCYSDDQFRISQNMAYRNDNSTSDGWGTERFRINTNGDTYAAIGGTLYANGNQVLTYAGGTLSNNYTFRSNLGGYLGSINSPPLQVYSESNNSAFMSFHKGGYYAVNFGLDADNVMRIGGWSASANRWQLDMSGNQTIAGDYYGNNHYANGHFRPYGDYGLYSQDYGGVFRRNTNSYGTWESVGYAKNGWGGYVNNNNYIVSWMLNTSGDFGFLTQNGNWWNLFYNNGNNCWGIGTDNTYSGDGFRCIKYGSAQYGWTTWSDRRAKENISTITGALDKVLNMRGVYFNYIIDEAKNKRVGFIAQELQQALPEAVRYAEEIDEYNVEYGQIVSVLAEAVKEHYAKTVAQQIEIEALKTQLQTLLN